jgi:hypothetical protein
MRTPYQKYICALIALAEASVFSVMDLQSGYWQLKISSEDRHKTAFITKYGLFEYTKMPFGLCSAPSTFQRCMELIFRGMQWKTLLVYFDDIILYSSNPDDHFEKLDEVLSRLQRAGLKLKPSKCEFIKDDVVYLGHVVCRNGIKPNHKIIDSVKHWKVPSSVKDVQKFLGLCNYYRSYVSRFSEVAAPLSSLTKKGVSFKWSEECNNSFLHLKKALCEAPILAYPMSKGQFILDTDASGVGIGAVLSQVQNNKERVISYGSKKLDKQQQRYSVTRRELLAVVTFIHKFRHYLLDKQFLLRTDHGSLRWLFGFTDPQGHDFDIQHRAGLKHQNTEALSRKDGDQPLCQHQLRTESQCNICLSLTQEWSEFKAEVDDVGTGPTKEIIRVVTRSQSTDSKLCNWLSGYTYIDLEKLQKEYTDLKIVQLV